LDVRSLAEVADAFVCTLAAVFDGADRACVFVADDAVFGTFSAVFADALPLPPWEALVDKLSVALAFAIGTLTFARTG